MADWCHQKICRQHRVFHLKCFNPCKPLRYNVKFVVKRYLKIFWVLHKFFVYSRQFSSNTSWFILLSRICRIGATVCKAQGIISKLLFSFDQDMTVEKTLLQTLMQLLFSFDQVIKVEKTFIQNLAGQRSSTFVSPFSFHLTRTWEFEN